MTIITYTNSSLQSRRRCPQEYRLGYMYRLERADEERIPLQVGTCWHRAHDSTYYDPYGQIAKHAPGALWAEKLARLYAAHLWYWKDQPLETIESEETFEVQWDGATFKGRRDKVVRIPDDPRRVLQEFKTASESLAADSKYWDKLRMDTQVGIYSLAMDPIPELILYDVVRKPTIAPKSIPKVDHARLTRDLEKLGAANYFDEVFSPEELEEPLAAKQESVRMYGARLTADIGNRPDYYFARRLVSRTHDDYEELRRDLAMQVATAEFEAQFEHSSRNPDRCNDFGRCGFYGLCSNNIRPRPDEVPEGYRRRAHLHPELIDDDEHRNATAPDETD